MNRLRLPVQRSCASVGVSLVVSVSAFAVFFASAFFSASARSSSDWP
jgi:hypothetical protein